MAARRPCSPAPRAEWVGGASALLAPLVGAIRRHVMAASKLHADDMRSVEKGRCQRFVQLRNGGKDESNTKGKIFKRSTRGSGQSGEDGRHIGSVAPAVNSAQDVGQLVTCFG